MKQSNRVPFSVTDFFARFPDDESCLTHIMDVRFGTRHVCRKCGKEATFHRMSDRRAFACANCGDHVYPTAGTVFEDTRTHLQLWFYAIYLFVTTRHGVSGKELQRTLGVTYKTAWRMGQHIRMLMTKADGFEMLQGHVELDEAYVGGKHSGGKRGRGAPGKTIVMGMQERGGRLAAEVIPDVRQATLRNVTLRNVAEGAIVSTDELMSYGLLEGDGYKHGTVRHGAREWSYYDYRHGDPQHEHGGVVLATVQELHPLDPHSCEPQIHGPLSAGVHFPREPSRDEERDVRPSDRGCLITFASARSKAAPSAGPTPRASSWRANSAKRADSIASFRVNMESRIGIGRESGNTADESRMRQVGVDFQGNYHMCYRWCRPACHAEAASRQGRQRGQNVEGNRGHRKGS